MADPVERLNQEEIIDSQEATAFLLSEYHRYACEGDGALEGLELARGLYESAVISDAQKIEDIESGTGLNHLINHDHLRRERLLETVSPERFVKSFSLIKSFIIGGMAGTMMPALPISARALGYACVAYNYADKQEEFQRDHFASILDEYLSEVDTSNLGFHEALSLKMDNEIEFMDEVVKPELDKRRKRTFGRALVVGAGLFVLKTLI